MMRYNGKKAVEIRRQSFFWSSFLAECSSCQAKSIGLYHSARLSGYGQTGSDIEVTGTEQQKEVIMQRTISRQLEPALAFYLMKFSLQMFEKELNELTVEEYAEAYLQACHELILHEKILLSDAACGVVIPEPLIRQAYETLQAEYGGEENFALHLQKNHLQPADYFARLGNDLRVEVVLARVAFHAAPVTDEEIEKYCESHRDSFRFREQRSARHILISTENHYSHLPQDSMLRRLSSLYDRLRRNPQSFSKEALLHSDCATASYGGDLGRLGRGELCPALDEALFQLAAGEISPVIRTKRGYHILYCEAIHRTEPVSIGDAHDQIRRLLTMKKKTQACRTWLMSLFASPV
jgi:nitrogen fixation protein NifM